MTGKSSQNSSTTVRWSVLHSQPCNSTNWKSWRSTPCIAPSSHRVSPPEIPCHPRRQRRPKNRVTHASDFIPTNLFSVPQTLNQPQPHSREQSRGCRNPQKELCLMSVLNTNQLKSALERLCLVVPKRATLPVLENLRWRAAKGHLELTATDLDNRLHISIPFVGEAIDSDVDTLVPAKELCQLVKTESAPSLKIRIRNGKCEVSASKRTVVLSCADPNSFPENPTGELKPQGQVLASAFDAALRRALFCVSTESGR